MRSPVIFAAANARAYKFAAHSSAQTWAGSPGVVPSAWFTIALMTASVNGCVSRLLHRAASPFDGRDSRTHPITPARLIFQ